MPKPAHPIWSLVLLVSALFHGLPALGQLSQTGELHLWAREMAAEREPLLLRLEGDVRLFGGDLRLLAEHLRWAPEADLLSASGQVELATPAWELAAQQLEFRPQAGLIVARNLRLTYRELALTASRADMTGDVWQLQEVEVRLADSPLVLQADRLRLLPGRSQENLLLEGVGLPGLPVRLPALTLQLPGLQPPETEVRSPLSVFQPEIGLGPSGLRAGFSSELWRQRDQRLYTRLSADGLLGARAELGHEWRPDGNWLLHSLIGLSHSQGSTQLQAQSEALWQSLPGLWLRGRARWQQPDSFLTEFWLPPLQPVSTLASGLELWLASDWIEGPGPVRTRFLAGAQWPRQQAGLTWLAQLPLWQSDRQSLESSLLVNGQLGNPATGGETAGSAGLRLLYQQQFMPNLTAGAYGEQYLSTWQPDRFAHPLRLTPWLGAYLLWQPLENLGLGLESALSLGTGRLALADALISWRLRPFYLHLLLQAIPAGVQLQTRFEL